MKEYMKPTIQEEELNIVDVIAESYGDSQAGDLVVNFFDE